MATEAARNILLSDDYVRKVTQLYDSVTTSLEAIGAIVPDHPLLQAVENTSFYMDMLKKEKRSWGHSFPFFDINGNLIETGLEKRIISMDLHQLRKVERSICVAVGEQNIPVFLELSRALDQYPHNGSLYAERLLNEYRIQ